MLIKTQDRWEAAYALLNQLIKDPTLYCNVCGTPFDERRKVRCCDTPLIGNHFEFLKKVVAQNKERVKANANSYGEGREGKMRACIAIPPVLLSDWEQAFTQLYKEKLIRNSKDLHDLMRKFPYLRTCDRV